MPAAASSSDWVAITVDPLPLAEATAWATTPASGAVVSFLGVVRDHSDGRDGVEAIDYEAYETEAQRRLEAVAAAVRHQWPMVERLALVHRVGSVALSEASVAVVVSAPHRPEAFDAARFAIDTLKETVPIWKRERWADGSGWATSGVPVRAVREPAASEQ